MPTWSKRTGPGSGNRSVISSTNPLRSRRNSTNSRELDGIFTNYQLPAKLIDNSARGEGSGQGAWRARHTTREYSCTRRCRSDPTKRTQFSTGFWMSSWTSPPLSRMRRGKGICSIQNRRSDEPTKLLFAGPCPRIQEFPYLCRRRQSGDLLS